MINSGPRTTGGDMISVAFSKPFLFLNHSLQHWILKVNAKGKVLDWMKYFQFTQEEIFDFLTLKSLILSYSQIPSFFMDPFTLYK